MRISTSILSIAIPLMAAGLAACPKDNTQATADDAGTATTATTPASTAQPTPKASDTASAVAIADAVDASVAPAASASASSSAQASNTDGGPAGATCGKKPLPDCPLQGWMKNNTGGAMQKKDFAALATALGTTASFAPAGYPNWVSISNDGAKAARAQSMDGVKASCSGCHNQYKQRYINEMRTRKI